MLSNQQIFNALEWRLRLSTASCLIFTEDDYLDITARLRLLTKHLTEMKRISFKRGFTFRRMGDGIYFGTKRRAKGLLN